MNDLKQIVIQTLSKSIINNHNNICSVTVSVYTLLSSIFLGIEDHFPGTNFHILKHEILVYIT